MGAPQEQQEQEVAREPCTPASLHLPVCETPTEGSSGSTASTASRLTGDVTTTRSAGSDATAGEDDAVTVASSTSSEDSVASGALSPATPVLSTKRRKPPAAGPARGGNKRRRLSRGWTTGGITQVDSDDSICARVKHDEEPSLLAQVASCFGKVEIGLSTAMVHVLSRVAFEASDVIYNCIKHYTSVFRHLGGEGVCLPASLALQVLGKRVEAICELYRSGHISVVHLLLSLFLLVTRGRLFKRNRLPTTATPGLVADAVPHDVRHWPVFVQLRVLRMVSPLLGCILQRALEAHDALLVECRMLTEEFCEDADRRAPCSATAPATVRLPSHVRAIALDLDDNIFLHGHIGSLRDVYWALAHARQGGTVPAKGASAGLLRDTVLPAVPHRQFLLELLDSCEASGVSLYMVSFGLPDWVVPITHAIFGGRLPLDRIYCMPGHPPLVPVVLNKNMWLADIAERSSVRPSQVLLVDDQASNLARALSAGFSTLQATPHEGLHAALWRDSLCSKSATAAAERAASRGVPFGVRARTLLRALVHSSAAYCPCDDARMYTKDDLAELVPAVVCATCARPPAPTAEDGDEVEAACCGCAAAPCCQHGTRDGVAASAAVAAPGVPPPTGSPAVAAAATPAAPETPLAAVLGSRLRFASSAFSAAAVAAEAGRHPRAGKPPRPVWRGCPAAVAAAAGKGAIHEAASGAKVIIVPRVTYAAVLPAAAHARSSSPLGALTGDARQREQQQQQLGEKQGGKRLQLPLPGPAPKEGRRDPNLCPTKHHPKQPQLSAVAAPLAAAFAAAALHDSAQQQERDRAPVAFASTAPHPATQQQLRRRERDLALPAAASVATASHGAAQKDPAAAMAARALQDAACAREAAGGALQSLPQALPRVVAEVLPDAQQVGVGDQAELPVPLLPGTPMRAAYVPALAST